MPLLEADDTDGGSRSHAEMAAAKLASYSSVELYPTAKPRQLTGRCDDGNRYQTIDCEWRCSAGRQDAELISAGRD